ATRRGSSSWVSTSLYREALTPHPAPSPVGRGERGLGRLTAASHHYRVPAAAGRRGALPDGVDDGTRGGTRRYHNTCDASCRPTTWRPTASVSRPWWSRTARTM